MFLTGIGGIGKSELAKRYANRYKKEYENVIYLRYTDNLKKTITGLNFVDDNWEMSEEKRFLEHYNFFKMLNGKTLVILDNFDTLPEHEALFHEFLNMKFQLLVTTRSHLDGVSCYNINEIMELENLLEIFYAYMPKSRDKESVVIEIIEEVYHHTLTVEMAAKTLQAAHMEPEQLLIELRKEGIRLSNPNKISVTKDAETKRERLYCHIQTLFQLQKLSVAYRDLLRYMTLMPEQGILCEVFHKWLHTNDYNSMNELVDLGWVQLDEQREAISLHPMLYEVIKAFEMPKFSNCGVVLRGIFLDCLFYGLDLPYYREILNTIESIYLNIEVDDIASACYFMDSAISYLEKYSNVDGMEQILDVMEQYIQIGRQHRTETALYYCYRGGIELRRGNNQRAIRFFENGVVYAEPVDSNYAKLASNLYCNLGTVYTRTGNLKAGKENMMKAARIRKLYHLPFNQDAIVLVTNYAQIIALRGKGKEAISYLSECISFLEQVENGMQITLGELYNVKGGIEKLMMNFPESRRDFEKAKKYWEGQLPQDDRRYKELEILMREKRFELPNKF